MHPAGEAPRRCAEPPRANPRWRRPRRRRHRNAVATTETACTTANAAARVKVANPPRTPAAAPAGGGGERLVTGPGVIKPRSPREKAAVRARRRPPIRGPPVRSIRRAVQTPQREPDASSPRYRRRRVRTPRSIADGASTQGPSPGPRPRRRGGPRGSADGLGSREIAESKRVVVFVRVPLPARACAVATRRTRASTRAGPACTPPSSRRTAPRSAPLAAPRVVQAEPPCAAGSSR